jgi:hypothetical protein
VSSILAGKLGIADSVYICQVDKVFIQYITDGFGRDMNVGIVCVIVASSLSSYLHHPAEIVTPSLVLLALVLVVP